MGQSICELNIVCCCHQKIYRLIKAINLSAEPKKDIFVLK